MLEATDFGEVYNMSDPDDSFKVFLREINPMLVDCFKRKKVQKEIFNVVYGITVSCHFSLEKKTDCTKSILKRKLQARKKNIINLEIYISTR